MKKVLTLILALALSVCCLGLIACNEEKDTVEGSYKLYSAQTSSGTFNLGDTFGMFGALTQDSISISVYENGTFNITERPQGSFINNSGTWVKEEDGSITITLLGDTTTATVNEGKLVWVRGTVTYTFTK